MNFKDFNQIFNYYDKDGSGNLDYKEFASIIFNG